MKYLWFEVTENCNSRCTYCNIWKKSKRYGKRRLTPQQLMNVLSDPAFQNIRYIINSGGEPTTEPLLLDFLLAEHKALPEATLQLSSNALLADRVLTVAKFMYHLNCKLQVGLSLDGVGEEHDKIRGVTGNFEKVKYLLPRLKKYGLVTLGATLTEETLEANLHAFEWAKKQGIPFMFHWLNRSSFYENLDSSYTNKAILSAVQLLPPSLYRDLWIKTLKGKKVHFNCKALTDFCVLKRNGDISPCLSHWNIIVGNVLDYTPSFLIQNAGREIVKQCKGCLNNWGVTWSIPFFERYFWALKEKVKGACKLQ